ncbi:hypothetical protein HPB47_007994 [Ixodes persulcatus]|uniref:Uncharacterized protein n=1 Tax=Ixodes persulcatus TaxID=34615 RepID=A0AC60P6B1_IXOPE|nr:hypothetical protein HPB47_007994 [Ixodes persulcatus]
MAFFGISLRKRHVDPGHFGHLSATRIPWSCKKKIIKAYRDATSARVLELKRASADMAFFGISLRKRHVDPGLFGHLSATRIPWSCKKKIIKAYRDATSARVLELKRASVRLWTILLGEGYRNHQRFRLWDTGRRQHFERNWLAVRATGGGPCPTPLSRTTERLTSFIGPLLEPLANCFDSDAVPSEVHEDTQSITTEQYYLPWDPEFEVTNPSSQADPASTGTQQASE